MSGAANCLPTTARLRKENERLRARVDEAEQVLTAIRSGDVDALVVSGPQGGQVFSLTGAEHAYRAVVETMNEAALTVDQDGTVLFCNRQFCDLLGTSIADAVGKKLANFVGHAQREPLQALLDDARSGPIRRRLILEATGGSVVPVQVAGSPLAPDGGSSLCLVVTDLTELEEERVRLLALLEEVRSARERMQTLSRRVVEVQEKERRAIAHELHDGAGQSLTAILLGLSLLQRELAADPAVVERIVELRRIADAVMEDLHRISVDLRPASLEHLGLVPALRQHLARVERHSNLRVNFLQRNLDDMRLAEVVETALFRVVQEAVTNVVRHAGATRIDVVVVRHGGRVRVVVEDDGAGFEPTEAEHGDHIGLIGMRERAEALGGTLTVETAPGRGATVVVEVGCADPHSDR